MFEDPLAECISHRHQRRLLPLREGEWNQCSKKSDEVPVQCRNATGEKLEYHALRRDGLTTTGFVSVNTGGTAEEGTVEASSLRCTE